MVRPVDPERSWATAAPAEGAEALQRKAAPLRRNAGGCHQCSCARRCASTPRRTSPTPRVAAGARCDRASTYGGRPRTRSRHRTDSGSATAGTPPRQRPEGSGRGRGGLGTPEFQPAQAPSERRLAATCDPPGLLGSGPLREEVVAGTALRELRVTGGEPRGSCSATFTPRCVRRPVASGRGPRPPGTGTRARPHRPPESTFRSIVGPCGAAGDGSLRPHTSSSDEDAQRLVFESPAADLSTRPGRRGSPADRGDPHDSARTASRTWSPSPSGRPAQAPPDGTARMDASPGESSRDGRRGPGRVRALHRRRQPVAQLHRQPDDDHHRDGSRRVWEWRTG